MPVELVAAAVLATGYKGPLSPEVFNKSLASPDSSVPAHHAERGCTGLQNLVQAVKQVPRFWDRAVPFNSLCRGVHVPDSKEKRLSPSRRQVGQLGSNL
jgi:hypothetical protein